jgi:hypothetical protein
VRLAGRKGSGMRECFFGRGGLSLTGMLARCAALPPSIGSRGQDVHMQAASLSKDEGRRFAANT